MKLIVTYRINELPPESVHIEVKPNRAKTFEEFQQLILEETKKRIGTVEGKVEIISVKDDNANAES